MIRMEDRTICSGCAACSNACPQNCISMIEDNEGFAYPMVNSNVCTGCGRCTSVCPVLNQSYYADLDEAKAYACRSKDRAIQLASSSGGVFSLLADDVLARNGVVFGAMFDGGFDVIHGHVMLASDLDRLRRSKYVQSAVGNSYREAETFLRTDRSVLFSGTPCQIAGLRGYLQADYSNLITCEVICKGVPSRKVYRKYLQFLRATYESEIRNINFRSKTRGWMNFGTQVEFENGAVYRSICSTEVLYMRGFVANQLYLRPSCYDCRFRHHDSRADITLGDYWRIERRYPRLYDRNGVSLVLVNTTAGEDAFGRIRGSMYCVQTDLGYALRTNTPLRTSSPAPRDRDSFFSDLDGLGYDKLMTRYCGVSPVNYWLTRWGLKPLVRRILDR